MFYIYLFQSTFAPDCFLISQCFFYSFEPLSYILLPLFCLFSYPSQSFSSFSPFRFFSSNDWHSTFLLFLAYFFPIGNVVDPLSVIEGGGNQKENPAYGADTLRLWVSGECFYLNFCPPFFSIAYWYMVLYLSFIYLFLSLQTLTHTLYKSSLLPPSLTHLLIYLFSHPLPSSLTHTLPMFVLSQVLTTARTYVSETVLSNKSLSHTVN